MQRLYSASESFSVWTTNIQVGNEWLSNRNPLSVNNFYGNISGNRKTTFP
jgi:hypothetical protein